MKYEPILNTVLNKNEMLLSADNAIESKSIGVGGFNLAVILWYVGLLMDQGGRFNEVTLMAFLCFGGSFIVLYQIIIPATYQSSAVELKDHQDYFTKEEEELYLQLISNAENAFEINNELLKKKSGKLKSVIYLTAVGSTFIVLSFVYNFFCNL